MQRDQLPFEATQDRTGPREQEGCIDFDCALAEYVAGGDAEELLRAAALVLGSSVPLGEAHADAIAAMTGCTCELADYDDAGRAVRRWFAFDGEAGREALTGHLQDEGAGAPATTTPLQPARLALGGQTGVGRSMSVGMPAAVL